MAPHTPDVDGWRHLRPATLTHLRQEERYTQQALATSLGVSQARVARIEKHGVRRLRVATLASYLEAGLGLRLMLVAENGERRFLIY